MLNFSCKLVNHYFMLQILELLYKFYGKIHIHYYFNVLFR